MLNTKLALFHRQQKHDNVSSESKSQFFSPYNHQSTNKASENQGTTTSHVIETYNGPSRTPNLHEFHNILKIRAIRCISMQSRNKNLQTAQNSALVHN